VILFADCCRDWKESVALTPPSIDPPPAQRPSGRSFYVRATQLDSKSWEKPVGNPVETRGVFSYLLLEALESPGFCDDEGRVTGSLLADRLVKDMQDQFKYQIPDPEFSKNPEIVLVQRVAPPKPKVTIQFDASVFGQTVDLYGKKYPKEPDHTQVADGRPWKLTLSPGLYQLKSRTTGNHVFIPLDGKQEAVNVDFPPKSAPSGRES